GWRTNQGGEMLWLSAIARAKSWMDDLTSGAVSSTEIAVREGDKAVAVDGSVKPPGCANCKTLVSVTAYHSFAGEVEAKHPHDTPPYPFTPSPTFAHSSKRKATLL